MLAKAGPKGLSISVRRVMWARSACAHDRSAISRAHCEVRRLPVQWSRMGRWRQGRIGQMAKHRAGMGADRWIFAVIGALAALGLIIGIGLTRIDESPQRAGNAAELGCDRPVRVVTASSFAPVLQAMAGELAK